MMEEVVADLAETGTDFAGPSLEVAAIEVETVLEAEAETADDSMTH